MGGSGLGVHALPYHPTPQSEPRMPIRGLNSVSLGQVACAMAAEPRDVIVPSTRGTVAVSQLHAGEGGRAGGEGGWGVDGGEPEALRWRCTPGPRSRGGGGGGGEAGSPLKKAPCAAGSPRCVANHRTSSGTAGAQGPCGTVCRSSASARIRKSARPFISPIARQRSAWPTARRRTSKRGPQPRLCRTPRPQPGRAPST